MFSLWVISDIESESTTLISIVAAFLSELSFSLFSALALLERETLELTCFDEASRDL